MGVNVDHSKLVDLVRRHFVNYTSTWERTADTRTVDTEAAEYTGGTMVKVWSFLMCCTEIQELSYMSLVCDSECLVGFFLQNNY